MQQLKQDGAQQQQVMVHSSGEENSVQQWCTAGCSSR